MKYPHADVDHQDKRHYCSEVHLWLQQYIDWGMKDSLLQDDLAKSWRQIFRWAVAEVPGRVQLETRSLSDGTLPVTSVTVRVKDKEFRPQDDASVKAEPVADTGVVTEAISPPGKGRVKYGGSFWKAVAEEPISVGTTVKIISQENLEVKVRPLSHSQEV